MHAMDIMDAAMDRKHVRRARRLACLVLALLIFCAGALPAAALAGPGFEPQSAAVYFVNLDTGIVAYQKNAHERRACASLTKMMTALLLIESGEDLSRMLTIPERLRGEFDKIQEENGADADLKIGEEITLLDLLYCTLLPSANDAASVIADHLSGGDLDAFAARMTERAAGLGCEDTRFSCAHGLYGEGNWSTAYDMALIARACREQPLFMQVATTTEYWLPLSNLHPESRDPEAPAGMSRRLRVTNVLQLPDQELYRPYIQGMKTGFTDEAGRCFVSTAVHEGETWLLAVLGAPIPLAEDGFNQAFHDTVDLYDWAFARFEVGGLPAAGEVATRLPLDYCEEADILPLYATEHLTTLIDRVEPGRLQVLPNYEGTPQPPIAAGQVLCTAQVFLDGELLGEIGLAAGQDYAFSKRLYWRAKLAPYQTELLVVGLALAFALLVLLPAVVILRKRAAPRRRAARLAALRRGAYRG